MLFGNFSKTKQSTPKLLFLSSLMTLIFFFVACSGAELKKSDKAPQKWIVLLPGYKGSELRANGKKVWLTPWQALNFGTTDLSLNQGVVLEPVGSIRSITLIPYLIDVDLYGPFLDHFGSKDSVQVVEFPYDWRKDNFATSQSIIRFLEDLKKKSNASISLVGHSNGGLLSLSVANQRPDLLESVVILGAPIRGGVGFMEDLISGMKTGLNSDIAGPCVVQTFELPYSFFPGPNPSDTKDILLDENRKPIQMDFFKASEWKKWKLGPFSTRDRKCKVELTESDLQGRLDKALKFKLSLQKDEKSKKSKVPLLVVSAENRSTRRNIVKAGEDWAFDQSDFVPGDGRVAKENSLPPTPDWTYEVFFSEKEHMSLLNDKKVWVKIESFLGI